MWSSTPAFLVKFTTYCKNMKRINAYEINVGSVDKFNCYDVTQKLSDIFIVLDLVDNVCRKSNDEARRNLTKELNTHTD